MVTDSVSTSEQQITETANIIRGLSMDAVQKAKSGHPGMPMGMADVATVLWTRFLKHNPNNPDWFNRDRFVLSGGHGSMLLYSLLHLSGYNLPLAELKRFRQWGSKTPGHPEYRETPGVETTTGPLGQGLSNAIGMALAEKSIGARFNTNENNIVDHHTYAICGDGDLQEGISHESSALAATWQLGKLVVLYDDNNITIDGPTHLSFTEDPLARYTAYGWHVQTIDGHNPTEIETAILAAQAETTRPSIIACQTTIGFGSPNKAGTAQVHGSPLGQPEIKLAKEALGLPTDKTFYISPAVQEFMQQTLTKGAATEDQWLNQLVDYQANQPDQYTQFQALITNNYGTDWATDLPTFTTDMATRQASGEVLNTIASKLPHLIGGSADLTPSNNTFPTTETAFSTQNTTGRYLHYGVREHGMGAIMNGLALHGGVLPYAGTFFVFSDYMRPAIRMAALMGLQVIYVFTHDSIGLGEDGPTHQPVEHLTALRVIPNLQVIRPADANETTIAWQMAIEHKHGPTALVLSRQTLQTADRDEVAPAQEATKGAYILLEDEEPSISLFASGSEVEILLQARERLNAIGINVRIISVPCFERFDEQPEEYQEEIIGYLPKVAIEAGSTLSWHKYLAGDAIVIGIDSFGASAPYKVLYDQFGINTENVLRATEYLLN